MPTLPAEVVFCANSTPLDSRNLTLVTKRPKAPHIECKKHINPYPITATAQRTKQNSYCRKAICKPLNNGISIIKLKHENGNASLRNPPRGHKDVKQGQDLYDVTARVLTGMRDVFKECKPDVVLVHGDTTTSTAAALAAFYQQIPVGHVEAGLRTHNIYSPWPEEMNRQITGRKAKLR